MAPTYETFHICRVAFKIGASEYSAGSLIQLHGQMLESYIRAGVVHPKPYRLEHAPVEEQE